MNLRLPTGVQAGLATPGTIETGINMKFGKQNDSGSADAEGGFDIKKLVADLLRSGEEPSADPRIIYALGAVGALLILAAVALKAWDGWAGWSTSRAASTGRQLVEQLTEAVAPYLAVQGDAEFKARALAALDDSAELSGLRSWLNERVPNVNGVAVYPGVALDQVPEELGPNGYALVSMMFNTSISGAAPLQIHNSLEPPQLVQLVRLTEDGEHRGFVSITSDPARVLQAFDPSVGSETYLALKQDYGRQSAKPLKEAGNPDFAPIQPDRVLVAGTLFRVEMPLHQANELLPWSRFITVVVVGFLMMGAARFLFEKNKRWLSAEEERAAEQKEKEAKTARLEKENKADRRATVEAANHMDGEAGPKAVKEKGDVSEQQAEPPPLRLRYDIAQRRKKDIEIPSVELQESIFRAYDIRGEIGKTLDVDIAYQVGQAVGSETIDQDAGPVVVARDGRLSGPQLVEGLINGIKSTGCDVLSIGMVPTGVLYYAAYEKGSGTGVMLTGSHNPPSYNGFKIMIGGKTLFGDQIKDLYRRIAQGDLRVGKGAITELDVKSDYIERIASDIQLEKPLKVVIDCGNGVGGVCAAAALRAVGAEVLPLFDEVDGTFPNHHPDPSDPHNLQDLIDSVKLMGADVGLALDGDADRLGVVTTEGEIVFPDRVMILLAKDVLERVPGATIIYDVKCTGKLGKAIADAGGKPVMYKTGHSLIKARMKELDSPFAGEMSGHFFFEERWYGVDDGVYGAARLLEILAKSEQTPTEILKALPTGVSTPELKVEMKEGENHDFIEKFQESAKFPGAEVTTIDGLRADFEDGWGLCRASNTTPVVILRFEADDETALARIQQAFAEKMLEINPNLTLPI